MQFVPVLGNWEIPKLPETPARQGPAMKTYRAFVLTPEGVVIQAIDLACETEEDAKTRVADLVTRLPIELWDGPRRVARFDPKP